jgi:hypothetical protein
VLEQRLDKVAAAVNPDVRPILPFTVRAMLVILSQQEANMR